MTRLWRLAEAQLSGCMGQATPGWSGRMIPFFPYIGHFRIFLGLLLLFIFFLIEINIISYAFERVGINHRYVFILLLIAFIGSAVNIPVARVSGQAEIVQEANHFGMHVIVPRTESVIVAVNVGGALIPTLVSLYLLVKMHYPFRALLGVLIVAAISHYFATPVPGMGITIPAFIPPIAAALCAVLLQRREAPQIAYIAGSIGTLIGADILNLGTVLMLGSPFVSIGGAGTFDGIFFSSIIAVLLVSI